MIECIPCLIRIRDGDKEITLDETDMFWKQVRTWHISEVMEFVHEKFEKFKNENQAAKWEMGVANGGAQQ